MLVARHRVAWEFLGNPREATCSEEARKQGKGESMNRGRMPLLPPRLSMVVIFVAFPTPYFLARRQGSGSRDSGADYEAAPDLDHHNPELRAALKDWLNWLHTVGREAPLRDLVSHAKGCACSGGVGGWDHRRS